MFLFGMVQEGPCGLTRLLHPQDEEVPDLATYGVDWEVHDDPALMNHFIENNPQDIIKADSSLLTTPTRMSHIVCDSPDAMLTPDEQQMFMQHIGEVEDITS